MAGTAPGALRWHLRERLAGWARRRQGTDRLPLTLHSRRIYILPTATGWGFALLLTVMLVAALNYGNSLGLVTTFMLGAYVVVGMHQTHAQLRNLQLLNLPDFEAFAGCECLLRLQALNPDREQRLGLQLRSQGDPPIFDLAPAPDVGLLQAPLILSRRGLQSLPRLELSSRAPLGLFRAWCWLHLDQRVLVYPRPDGTLPLPATAGAERRDSRTAQQDGSEEWQQLRPYQDGDSPRSVAWKRYAAGGELQVSQFHDPEGAEHLLDFAALGSLGTEQRLSQLCAWVLECEQRRMPYALRLPGVQLHPGLGSEQRLRALGALARFGQS
ncbi:MAG: DUF58 domain-containing protein [Steroidobacteraceae bacterium]